MTTYSRYAIYYAPEPGPLADFGAAWLGWDAAQGVEVAHPNIPDLPRPLAEITAAPRKYGFHGTLKPPFRLATDHDRNALTAGLDALAHRLRPVSLDGLGLSRMGGFLALTPQGDTTALSQLAARCVADLDKFRAFPTEEDLTRRRSSGLSPVQEENLARWGYPYVMDDFRFHLTLTGRLPRAELETVRTLLGQHLEPLLPRPFVVTDLCLFGEAEDGRFHILSRHELRG